MILPKRGYVLLCTWHPMRFLELVVATSDYRKRFHRGQILSPELASPRSEGGLLPRMEASRIITWDGFALRPPRSVLHELIVLAMTVLHHKQNLALLASRYRRAIRFVIRVVHQARCQVRRVTRAWDTQQQLHLKNGELITRLSVAQNNQVLNGASYRTVAGEEHETDCGVKASKVVS